MNPPDNREPHDEDLELPAVPEPAAPAVPAQSAVPAQPEPPPVAPPPLAAQMLPPAVPVAPDVPLVPGQRPSTRRPIVAALVVVLLALIAYKLLHHHRSQYEATADAVTAAIVADNMTPVEHKFSDRLQSQLLNHEHVGELADSVAPLGKFEGSKETTPAGSGVGFHEFDVKFANGTWDEKYLLDSDGKIARFHIGPKATAAP